MKGPKIVKLVSLVATLHVFALSLFFSKPPGKYFFVTCIGTIVVWGWVFSLRAQKRKVGIIAGVVVALVIQQFAFHVWRAEIPGVWWPLLQFASLQCLVALSCSSSLG